MIFRFGMVKLFIYEEASSFAGQCSMDSGFNSLNFTHFHFPFSFKASKMTVSLTLAWGGSSFRGTSTWPWNVAMMAMSPTIIEMLPRRGSPVSCAVALVAISRTTVAIKSA